MSLLRLRNGPLGENGAFASNVTGNGLTTLAVPYGLSNDVPLSRTSEPHGGATDVLRWNWPLTNSNDLPYEARMFVLPEPVGSHATPTRGPKLVHCGSIPACVGNPGSPGKYRPAGAFGNTVLWTFWLNRV